jgi:hypothetical protein
MPKRLQQPSGRVAPLGVALLLGLGVAVPLSAQLSRLNTFRNFKVIEPFAADELRPGQTNRTKTLLTAAEVQQAIGKPAFARQMRIDHLRPDGETNFIARAPECWLELRDRIASSTGRLEVASADGRFVIEGNEGFTCWITNAQIIISNHVRTEIHRALLESITP